MSTNLEKLQSDLEQRRTESLYRTRLVVDSPQGPEIRIEGKNYLSFCSNDYLGLANHPKVIEGLANGARRYGVGSGAAHLVTGHSTPHHALEEALAEFTGYPRALLFSTGYMANLGVISSLVDRGDSVFEDRLNHASLLDGALLSGARLKRYPHVDMQSLDRRLGESKSAGKLIVTDGVFSMDGDIAPLESLTEIAKRHQAGLMIDDAHGFGVLGEQGRGTLEHFNNQIEEAPILMCTLGKALGTFGAFVAADEIIIETLIQKARSYIYTTALPPAIAQATLMSLKLIKEEGWRRQHLAELITYFHTSAEQLNLPLLPSHTPIQPVIIGESNRAISIAMALRDKGIVISAIRPPTVPLGSARLRITLSASHTKEHIDRLLQALSEVA